MKKSIEVVLALSLLGAIVGCEAAREEVVTSPFVGAERIHVEGTARALEVLRAGGYAYLRLEGVPDGTWFVTADRPPRVGDLVQYRGYATTVDFRSRSLDRSFPVVIFSATQPGNQTQPGTATSTAAASAS